MVGNTPVLITAWCQLYQDQSNNQTIKQSIKQTNKQSIKQSIKQTIYKSNNRSIYVHCLDKEKLKEVYKISPMKEEIVANIYLNSYFMNCFRLA